MRLALPFLVPVISLTGDPCHVDVGAVTSIFFAVDRYQTISRFLFLCTSIFIPLYYNYF